LHVLLTGEQDGYYSEFGTVTQLAKAFHRPFVHDGQYSTHRKRRFGAPADDVPPERFVVFSQNHDQVGNRAFGDRLPVHARPVAAFCTLLAPFVPLLFMGEEYGERAPFQFFSDHIDKKIAKATREGRRREFASFTEFREEEIPREVDADLLRLYGALLDARRRLPRGDADDVAYDEEARWLRVRRGPYELVCNFADRPSRIPCAGSEARLATHGTPNVRDGQIELEPFAGALVA
jgi:maltooligosyltrehalose trehalohydrolase